MDINHQPQSTTNHFLTPFTIASDCAQEHREIIYRIIINLKINLFKKTKHIQQINIHRNYLAHYLPEKLLDRDQFNNNYTFTLTDENGNRKTFYNFQNETTLSGMFKTFLKRHEDSQDRTKLTAKPSTTFGILRNTIVYVNEQKKQIQSVNDRLRNDIINYNNWLTKIIELKPELKTATSDVMKIVSGFTFLFWLDNFEHNNDKRIQFGETFHEEIENLCIELKSIWKNEYYSQHFESTIKICSDSINCIVGLENYVKIEDQGQAGSSSFNLSRSLTSTSTPKDVQINTNLQSKQKSIIKPDKQLSSNLFGNQQNIADKIDISDSEERNLRIGNLLPPTVNQKVLRKNENPTQYNHNRNNTYISSSNDNREQHELFWEQQMYNYQDLKEEITEKVTNHTNKLMDKFRQVNESIERKQEEALEMVFDKLERTLDNINRQNNLRSENGASNNDRNSNNNSIQTNNFQNSRQQENRTRRSNSIATEGTETTVREPPLRFYKQLTSVSMHGEPRIEQNISSGSVPTTIRPFDGTDPAYTVEEYLNSIVAAMIFSSGIEPVNKPGHHQWKVKRAALILHTLQAPAQKWYSTLPSDTILDSKTFCKEFSDIFDSEKSKQQAKIVLQQLQKHTNESLRSRALRIETLVKTAYSLYTEDYRNSVMNQTFIRCLDNELKTAALKNHANHKQTPREPEMPFKTLVDKIDQMDLTRTIANNHKRLYEVNQNTTNTNEDLKQMNIACNKINDLNQNDSEHFEGTICNVLNGIKNTYDRKNFKGRPNWHSFAAIAVHTVTQKADALKDHEEKALHDQKKDHFIVICEIIKIYITEELIRITSTDENYHQHNQYTTIHEAEHHTDRSQETIPTIPHITETIKIIKDIETRIIIITIEAGVIIEIIIIEVELTITTEIIIIIDTTIADQTQDTQTAVTHDSIHRITEIIIIIITIIVIITIIIDKEIIVKTQTQVTDTDNDQVVTIDIILTIIIGMTEEIQHKENKIIDIIQLIEEQTEINTTITIKTE